jgi:hypothetical protein
LQRSPCSNIGAISLSNTFFRWFSAIGEWAAAGVGVSTIVGKGPPVYRMKTTRWALPFRYHLPSIIDWSGPRFPTYRPPTAGRSKLKWGERNSTFAPGKPLRRSVMSSSETFRLPEESAETCRTETPGDWASSTALVQVPMMLGDSAPLPLFNKRTPKSARISCENGSSDRPASKNHVTPSPVCAR